MAFPALVDWDHVKSLLLISMFKKHEVLWNPNNKGFNDPKKKEEAWWALAKEIGVPPKELKRKIECLRGSYRRERSRVRLCKKKEENYCPKWFAYKSLAFLEQTRPQAQDASFSEHSGDLEDVSAPNIPQPSKLEKLYFLKKIRDLNNHEYILPQEKLELSPKKKKFSSTSSPCALTEPKLEFMKQKPTIDIESTMETTLSVTHTVIDPLETLTETSSKDGTGLQDRLGEDMLEPGVNALQGGSVANMTVGFSGSGYMSDNSSSTSDNTVPAAPNDKVLKRKLSTDQNDSRDVSKRHSKPLQRQEIDKLDECTAFGQLVESTLRKLSGAERIRAKMKVSQVLWEIELEALNIPKTSPTKSPPPPFHRTLRVNPKVLTPATTPGSKLLNSEFNFDPTRSTKS